MNRDEQIAAAHQFAEDNPEWELRQWGDHGVRLWRRDKAAQIQPRGFHSWAAYKTGGLFMSRLRTTTGRALSFRSIPAAVKALGYPVNEREGK